MKDVSMGTQRNGRVYVMYNKSNGVTIECTEKYLITWLARGFEVIEIKESSSSELDKPDIDNYTNL